MGGAVLQQLPRSRRQLKKAFHNFVLTVVCGFTTVLVLKGTTGFQESAPSLHARPYFLTNHYSPPPFTPPRSELQHARLLAEVKNLIHITQPQSVTPSIILSHGEHPLQSVDFIPNPNLKPGFVIENPIQSSDQNPNPNPNPILTENPVQYTDKNTNPNPILTESPIQSTDNIPNPNPILTENPLQFTDKNPNPNPIFTENPLQFIDQRPQDPYYKPDHELLNLPKISSWDEQRTQLSTHSESSILLVTGSQPSPCDNPMGDHYLMKSLKNKMDYCRLHDLDIFYNMANLDPQMSGFWAKLPLLRRLMLAHPEKEWLWWMDSDAMITDMAFELPMDRYTEHNLVLHGWKELVYEQKNWIGLNTGSFLIRNCQWSLNLLHAWAPMGPKGKIREEAGQLLSKALVGRPQFEADDQSALIYLLNQEKEKWANKVYLENTYYLHGYWLIIVDKYEEMMGRYHSGLGDERWPFVTHFVGCKPCSSNKLTLQDKCLEHMERAFNFADNQVLQFYGFQHEALNTHILIKSAGLSS